MAEGPEHIGIILDGNRRYAKKLGLKPWEGHKKGYDNVKRVLEWALKQGIKELTLYSFSMQNFNRPKDEFAFIMKYFNTAFNEAADGKEFHENRIKLRAIGRTHLLPEDVQKAIKKAEQATKDYDKLKLNIAIAYGGREEIADSVKKIVEKVENGAISRHDIGENTVQDNLYMKDEPDLIIRTGGERRTSNFLLWQSYYSEWMFVEKMWPEFTEQDFIDCIEDFRQRQRRFGR